MKIISASRRTDIPAFYSEWFMDRIRAGYVRWMNPFSKAVTRVPLRPEDVSAIAFWSKNYIPLLPRLDELDAGGYPMLFHFTITGLPKVFEPRVPDVPELVECARTLSDRYGPDAISWRYDPVLISSVTSPGYHLDRFRGLCADLEGSVKRCYFSFTKFYGKVLRNAEALSDETGIAVYDLPRDDRIELADSLAGIAAEHGIDMHTCCGDYLVSGRIEKAHCIDANLLQRLFPNKVGHMAPRPTREECGCCECTDIGAYDTCPHGCFYCYANTNKHTALRNYQRHDTGTDMLGVQGSAIQLQGRSESPSLKLDL